MYQSKVEMKEYSCALSLAPYMYFSIKILCWFVVGLSFLRLALE